MIRIEIEDQQFQAAMQALSAAAGDTRPALRQMGEQLVESTKARFRDGVRPDGERWAPNTEATYLAYLSPYSGSFSKRTGRVLKAGADRAMGKQPLIGESRRLSSEIEYQVGDGYLEVGSGLKYSAVHQFGAAKGAFGATKRGAPIPWGAIPARPFLGLSAQDEQDAIAALREHLDQAFSG
jgi:phage virion morphogenesis protein